MSPASSGGPDAPEALVVRKRRQNQTPQIAAGPSGSDGTISPYPMDPSPLDGASSGHMDTCVPALTSPSLARRGQAQRVRRPRQWLPSFGDFGNGSLGGSHPEDPFLAGEPSPGVGSGGLTGGTSSSDECGSAIVQRSARTSAQKSDQESDQKSVRRSSRASNSAENTSSSEGPSVRFSSTTTSSPLTDSGARKSILKKTIAAFPVPPPTTESGSSYGATEASDPEVPQAAKSHVDPMLAARVKILPGLRSLQTGVEQSLWVSVDIASDVNWSALNPPKSSKPTGLDLVLCLDISASTSPAALINMHEITRLIASMLNPSRDRLGVVTTPTAQSDGIIVHPSHANVMKPRKVLDEIRGAGQEPPTVDGLLDGLMTSVNVLLGLIPVREEEQGHHGGRLSLRRSHIILVSANLATVAPAMAISLPVDVINPAIVPWYQIEGQGSGWRLGSTYPSRLKSTPLSKDGDGLRVQVRKVLNHARRGIRPGYLHDVHVDVTPGKTFEIESILGDQSRARIGAGETAQLFVKLRERAQLHEQKPPSTSDVDTMFAELDDLLGESVVEALSAEVKYRHSQMPYDTVLSTKAKSSIHRHTPGSTWTSSGAAGCPDDTLPKRRLQKRFAFFTATRHGPRHALASLKTTFGADGRLSVCPGYIKQIFDELRYQVRVADRFGLNP
ncbi:MAG: hypothetical protein M1832_001043 [Thelocarpon impressellum]|nr:MAG: hypothetical protein M1832_001043 [Thelocarpon impressellum]